MNALDRLKEIGQELTNLQNALELLYWDQETKMPKLAVSERAEQIACLSKIIHEKSTAPEIEGLFETMGIEGEGDIRNDRYNELDSGFLRHFFRDFSKQRKIPSRLVSDLAKATSLAQNNWIVARKKNDFNLFLPFLRRNIDLLIEKADCLGYAAHPYDPLLDEYEPYADTELIDRVFETLQVRLSDIVRKIQSSDQVDSSFLETRFNTGKQDRFGREVIADLGYSMENGRLDISAHPFTITLGSRDVRITTRFSEKSLLSGLFSNIHETGHALYELGFDDEIRNNILATGTSLGMHESQSRLWENQLGRSLSFWRQYLPRLQKYFPKQLAGIDPEQFYRAVNSVRPSMIRVEADEVTYNLHIILRFNLEKELMARRLDAADLPDRWDDLMEQYLGIRPENPAEGVLQDVHWSAGLIGYFPTYALGNLYSAQLFRRMKTDIADLDTQVAAGQFGGILSWLRTHVHRHGAAYSAEEICRRVTGEGLNPDHFLSYIEEKYRGIYGFD